MDYHLLFKSVFMLWTDSACLNKKKHPSSFATKFWIFPLENTTLKKMGIWIASGWKSITANVTAKVVFL